MKLINLTPHNITLKSKDGFELTVESTGLARCECTDTLVETVQTPDLTLDVMKKSFGKVNGLPEPQPDTAYIVSRIIAEACPERDDLYITGNPIRDEAGRIIGCSCLCKI